MTDNTDRLDQILEARSALQSLVKSQGWDILVRGLQSQIIARRREDYHKGIVSLDSAFQSAQTRGEISGAELALELPKLLIEEYTGEFERLRQQQEQENAAGEGSAGNADDGFDFDFGRSNDGGDPVP